MVGRGNRWLAAALLVGALVGSADARAAPTPAADETAAIMSDKYEDNMTRAIAVLWAGADTQPVGFVRTRDALVAVHNELAAPALKGAKLPGPLAYAKRVASGFLSVCELSSPGCALVFEQIDDLERDLVVRDSVNMRPFLAVCKQAQHAFCDSAGRDEAAKKEAWSVVKRKNKSYLPQSAQNGGNLFEKMLTVCWPKCERD